MASFTPCEGTGKPAADMYFSPSRPDGLGFTRAKTFGKCPACGRDELRYGDWRYPAGEFVIRRHKDQRPTGTGTA